MKSWTPMTANMKRRRTVTSRMLPMFFTATITHCTTCFRPLARLIALNKRILSKKWSKQIVREYEVRKHWLVT